ncbi:class I SAM-dependent methyltransferase [uncultured Polaribacter sp.]|uniref:class I SAM-dependent methyltransferase n=1 Tax=uncultured Polaribacter sp. TaxID=174711 RepID=UPI002602DBAB|nr:class I SAM-dependent methyltransferase [uncultured Polaribacter sp.]
MKKKEEILSPLNKSKNVTFISSISVKQIIRDYKKFSIDVTGYFRGLNKIKIYQCNETGYRFYYPFNLAGDSKFYEHFQEFDWYYMPWKWEHEITQKYVSDGINVLEVGCAQGAFIKKINTLFNLNKTVGLELNESAVSKSKKWEILNQTVQSFSKKNKDEFDLVCSYQVLEHIAEVKSFLQAKIDCLKVGGKLIISVPNNNSFIKNADNCLNNPPHHMGLWEEKSLKSLEKLYPLKVVDVHFEGLQEYHLDHYVSAVYYSKYPFMLLRKIVRKINKIFGFHQAFIKKVNSKKDDLIGQTILVVYQKI